MDAMNIDYAVKINMMPLMTDTDKQKPRDIQKPDADPKSPSEDTAGQISESEPEEYGGPKGLEPTRYGDWERKGILSDF